MADERNYRDFLLKPELLRAISDLGFEHPSEGETCSTTCNESELWTWLTPRSPAGVHPPGYPRYRCPLSGQVGYG